MVAGLFISPDQWQMMKAHVTGSDPIEACGMLGGIGDRVEIVIPVTNAEQSPVRFRMDPQEQWRAFCLLEEKGFDLIGVYHSHPNGPDTLSETDIAESIYPIIHVIWFPQHAAWQARGFFYDGISVREISLQMVAKE